MDYQRHAEKMAEAIEEYLGMPGEREPLIGHCNALSNYKQAKKGDPDIGNYVEQMRRSAAL